MNEITEDFGPFLDAWAAAERSGDAAATGRLLIAGTPGAPGPSSP